MAFFASSSGLATQPAFSFLAALARFRPYASTLSWNAVIVGTPERSWCNCCSFKRGQKSCQLFFQRRSVYTLGGTGSNRREGSVRFEFDRNGRLGCLVLHPPQEQVKHFGSSAMDFLFGVGAVDNEGMVNRLQHSGVIHSERVAQAMKQIDRGLFTPDPRTAYVDSPMPIGHNATISAPHMHAMCLDLLAQHLQPGARCLDVGAGTGYLTAVMGLLVGESGRVIGVEHIPELVEKSRTDVARSQAGALLHMGVIGLHVGDGRQGWPQEAPYDAIHVGAAAGRMPKHLVEQLKPGGRMVIPVGELFQDLMVVDKMLDGSTREIKATEVRYVPLTTREAQLQGY